MERMDPIFARGFDVSPSKGDRRRFEIVQAAVRCIADDGLDGGILNRVAEKVGIQRSNVAYYFKTKEDLLEAAVRYAMLCGQALTQERIDRARSARERVDAITDGAFDWRERYPDQLRLLLLFYFHCMRSAPLRKLHSQFRKAGWERVRLILRESSPASRALDSAAKAIQSEIMGILVELGSTQDERFDYRGCCLAACRELAAPFLRS